MEQLSWPKISGNDLTQIDFFPNGSKITPKFLNSALNPKRIKERSSPSSTISGINKVWDTIDLCFKEVLSFS